jgi:lipopolysaccharide export LptBFGC system permease protein LptF
MNELEKYNRMNRWSWVGIFAVLAVLFFWVAPSERSGLVISFVVAIGVFGCGVTFLLRHGG